MAQIQKGTTYSTGDQVTATNLNALADAAILLPGAITDQTAKTVPLAADTILLHSAADTALRKSTLTQLFANATGIPISTGVSGLGTGIATALAVNSGSTGAPALLGSAGAFTTLSASGVASFLGLKAQKATATSGFISAIDEGANVYNVLGSRNNADSAYLPLVIRGTTVTLGATSDIATFSSAGLGVTGVSTSSGSMRITTNNVYYRGTTSGGAEQILIGIGADDNTAVVAKSGGTIKMDIGASNSATFSSTGLAVTGAITASTNLVAQSGALFVGSGGYQLYLRTISGTNRIDSYNNPITATVPLQLNASTYAFQIADSTKMTLDSSGNVGIGTSSPAAQLQVGTGTDVGAGTGTGQICVSGAGSTLAVTGKPAVYHRNSVGLGLYSDYAISFEVNGGTTKKEAARIDSSGVLCVGATVFGYAVRAGFRGDSTSVSTVEIQNESSTGTMLTFRTNGESQVGSISFTASGVTYNTSSDYRRKSNVKDLTGSGTFIDALKPRAFDWDTGDKGVGFIAHEFAEVSPTSVTGEKDAVDSDGKPVYQAMQASSAEVIANLVAELQSLRQRVAALESN
jgi:hypothetical protein